MEPDSSSNVWGVRRLRQYLHDIPFTIYTPRLWNTTSNRGTQRTAEQDLAHTGSTTRHLRMRTLSDLNKDVVYFISRHDHRGLYTPLPEPQLFLGLSEPTPLSSEMCRHDCCVQSGVELVQTAAGMINFVQLIIKWFVL